MEHGRNPITVTAEPQPVTQRANVVNAMPLAGELVAGKYVVERVIGRGGMGVVLAAHHCLLQQRVAIKLLLPDARTNPELEARFLREAQAVAQLRSEHVARVMDVGTLDSGSPFMVMEYLEGEDLGEILTERRHLPLQEAVDVMLQALDVVAEAHAKGMVHRDLKPSNLFCTQGPDGLPLVKVLDFGISKPVAGGDDTSLTSTGAVMGSPIYMSPEQVRSSRSIDIRSDIWSLGVVLYELLTGRPPFMGQTIGEVFAAILETTPVSPRQWVPEIPPAVEEAIMACLQRDVALRLPDVSALALAIAPYASARIQPLVERIAGVCQFAGASMRTSLLMHAGAVSPSGRNLGPFASSTERGGTFIQWGNTGASAASSPRSMRGLVAFGLGMALLCGGVGWSMGTRAPSAAPEGWNSKEPTVAHAAANSRDDNASPRTDVEAATPATPAAATVPSPEARVIAAAGGILPATRDAARVEPRVETKTSAKDAKDAKGSKPKDGKESKEAKVSSAASAAPVAAEKPVDLRLDGRE